MFASLDPDWYSTNSVDNGYGDFQHPNNDLWLITPEDPEYFWLKSTLERS